MRWSNLRRISHNPKHDEDSDDESPAMMIPDLDEEQAEDITRQVAEAPTLKSSRVQTLKELDRVRVRVGVRVGARVGWRARARVRAAVRGWGCVRARFRARFRARARAGVRRTKRRRVDP